MAMTEEAPRAKRRYIEHVEEVLGWMDGGMTPTEASAAYESKYRERFRPEAFGRKYKEMRGHSPVQRREQNPYLEGWDLGEHRKEYYAGLLRAVWRRKRGMEISDAWERILASTRAYLDGGNDLGVQLVIDYQPWDPNIFVYVERVEGDTDWTHAPKPGERKRIGPR